jgi:hypothetical protein
VMARAHALVSRFIPPSSVRSRCRPNRRCLRPRGPRWLRERRRFAAEHRIDRPQGPR